VGAGGDRRSGNQLLQCDDCCDSRRRPTRLGPEPTRHAPSPQVFYNADGKPTDTCTAGWLVHDSGGQQSLLTAGYCDDGGGVNYFNKTRGFRAVGWFTHQAYGGDESDIALLGIANSPNGPPQVATDTRIIGIRPVTAPVDDTRLAKGQQLCHYGLITGPQHGGPECGPITDVGPAKVKFLADVEKGDSGGPVCYRNADDTATPVGITIRAAGADGGTVAELIGTWLKRWNLSVDSDSS
jgi:hypothetical protein